MKINLPKDLHKSSLTDVHSMDFGKVYRIGSLFISRDNCDGYIVIDSSDNEVMTFNDYSDFNEWLRDNEYGTSGELTPYEMQIIIK